MVIEGFNSAQLPLVAALATPEDLWSSSDESLMSVAREIQSLIAGAALDLPMMYAPNPETEASCRRVRVWVRETGLVRSDRAYAWYCDWEIEKFVGGSYAQATGDGLDLCNKTVSWVALFDDQLDGLQGESVGKARDIVCSFLAELHGVKTPEGDLGPLIPTFREIWEESKKGRSPSWVARAVSGWEYFLTASIYEASNRALDQKLPRRLDLFSELRGGSGAMEPFLNILEPGAGYELAPTLFNSPHIRRMRSCVVNLVNDLNDVYSLHKEVARRERENHVLVVQEEFNLSLVGAVEMILQRIHSEASRLVELNSQIPDICAALRLGEVDRRIVAGYADALELYISGFLAWQRSSRRYTQALESRPPAVPWASDELIHGLNGS